jgi:hypothetical protein
VSELAAGALSGPSHALKRTGALACVSSNNWALPRHLSTESGEEEREITSPRVLELSQQILQLNLLEVSDLTEVLRKRLNIQAPAFGASFAASLPTASGVQAASAGGE